MRSLNRQETEGPTDREEAADAPPTRPVPRIVRPTVARHGWRHIKGVAAIRALVAIWLVALGTYFCVTDRWWGTALYPAAAGVGWLAYQMPRWKTALDAENARRVRTLERFRAEVVDDAAARLRRIEQDLHDGAQAQMVAVVMKLGLAREHLKGVVDGSPEADADRALWLVDAAHTGALEAIAELRDLARGIHPPALGEGLGAALAVLGERSDLVVELTVDLPERPSAAIETIAYFCAAELLTNAAKHSGATEVTLEALRAGEVVTLRVGDNGAGGARLEAGGGLAGLVTRVETVDGHLEVDSPAGGPTLVTVTLPSHA